MTKINPTSLEMLAVSSIVTLAMQPGTSLEPSIPIGDKGISFDGHISVFKDSSLKKSSLLRRIPVQVKGKGVSNFSLFQTKYSKLEIDDIQNYYNEGGVIFFVCEVTGSGQVEIFAKILLPLDLKHLINQYRNQQTTTIYLQHIKNLDMLTSICNQFIKEQRRQPIGYIGKHSFHPQKFEKYTASRISFDPSENHNALVNHEMYFYGIEEGVEFPIGLIKLDGIVMEGETNIEINGSSIPYHYKISEYADRTEILFEHSLLISFIPKSESVKIKVLKIHTLEAYRKILSLLEYIKVEESIHLFNNAIVIRNLKWNKEDDINIEKDKSWLKTISTVYDKIGIPHNYVSKGTDVTLNDFSKKLSKAFIHKNFDSLIKKYPSGMGLLYIRLGEDCILTFYSPNEVEKIQSVADENFKNKQISLGFDQNSERFKISPFLLATPKILFSAANVTLELVSESFHPDSHTYNKFTFSRTNQFCLDCLKAYDENKYNDYLSLAKTIYSQLLRSDITIDDFNVATINYYQILYRENKMLSDEHLLHLVEIKEHPSNAKNKMLILCCNILLENIVESKYYYKKLDEEQKSDFNNFPIYSLYKLLTEKI